MTFLEGLELRGIKNIKGLCGAGIVGVYNRFVYFFYVVAIIAGAILCGCPHRKSAHVPGDRKGLPLLS